MTLVLRAGTSHSTILDAEKAAEAASRSALDKAGISKADTALLFTSSEYFPRYEKIVRKIRSVTGARKIVGTSGRGTITDKTEIEHRPSLVVMVLQSEEVHTEPFLFSNLQESNFKAGEQTGLLLREKDIQPNALVLFADPFSFQSSLFFDGFENAYGYVPILGAAAAENGQEEKTFQICCEQIEIDSLCGLALAGDFRIETGITRSCQPVGEAFQITRADGNMIYEMDGRPAYDIFLESISQLEASISGASPFRGKNSDQIFQHIFLGMPLRSFQTDFVQAPYLIRNIMGVNAKKGVLACVSPVEEGNFVTFTVRDSRLADLDMKNMLEDLKIRVSSNKVLAGFYFNCCARGEMLYGKRNHDISLIGKYFPEVPLIGLFSYGEIAPVDHVNHLHQHCGVLTLLLQN